MKYAIMFLTSLFFATSVYAGGEIKEVCKDKKDNAGKVIKDKNGKALQTCKKIKVHKKLKGTKVPPNKK